MSTMLPFRPLLLAMALVVPIPARAQTCAPSEDSRASHELAQAGSVTEVQEIARRHPGCMAGGGLAEEVSDKVASTLSNHWSASLAQFPRGKSGDALEAFVVNNLNETDASEDLKKVLNHARHDCPAHLAKRCKRIERATKTALDGIG
ncbi:hypothetical protein [Phenylobacterium sp.]|uniref:hypothetical protein n=1 Tax=Phenylobacterium sp. TaxID=1871053 RepID=UPI00121B19BB|nr:hypothetical protein [Phenylobacterium sp.]THD60768.1 MAG: hypothetical protein E8A49_13050 [Phenylobacterium sp.]